MDTRGGCRFEHSIILLLVILLSLKNRILNINFNDNSIMKQKTMNNLVLLAIFALFGYLLYSSGALNFQVTPTPTGETPAVPTGYTPWAVGEVDIPLRDAFNPSSAIASTTIQAKVFSEDTPDSILASPTTPYLDSATSSGGKIALTGKRMLTGHTYKVVLKDTASTPVYYAKKKDISIPALDPNLGGSYVYTTENVQLEKIGTFADVLQSCTGPGGASLPTGVSVSGQTITINKTEATSPVTIRCSVKFANTVANSILKDVVFRPIQDTSDPMPVNAFTSVSLTYDSGTNFNLPSDLTAYVSGQTPINIGDVSSSDSGNYYIQFTVDTSSLSDGDTMLFKVDDLGNWLATDPYAAQSGATAAGFSITTTE